MLRTFSACSVVICRRWTGETRPSGCSMAMRTLRLPAKARTAAAPVSPEVAPTMVMRSSRRSRTRSNIRARSCIAKSLNASVGPWNSSSSHSSGPSCLSGAVAGWAKPA